MQKYIVVSTDPEDPVSVHPNMESVRDHIAYYINHPQLQNMRVDFEIYDAHYEGRVRLNASQV